MKSNPQSGKNGCCEKCLEKPHDTYDHLGCPCHSEEAAKVREIKEALGVVPSPRIDWCSACQAEHGYDCPKDNSPVSPSKNIEDYARTCAEYAEFCRTVGTHPSPSQEGWEVNLAPMGTALAEFQAVRTDAVSEMLDEPYANGIYRTSRLYSKLDASVEKLLSQARASTLKEVEGEPFDISKP